MARPLVIECDRCGEQMQIERASRFREQDYYELWREYMALDADFRTACVGMARGWTDMKWATEEEIEALGLRLYRTFMDSQAGNEERQ